MNWSAMQWTQKNKTGAARNNSISRRQFTARDELRIRNMKFNGDRVQVSLYRVKHQIPRSSAHLFDTLCEIVSADVGCISSFIGFAVSNSSRAPFPPVHAPRTRSREPRCSLPIDDGINGHERYTPGNLQKNEPGEWNDRKSRNDFSREESGANRSRNHSIKGKFGTASDRLEMFLTAIGLLHRVERDSVIFITIGCRHFWTSLEVWFSLSTRGNKRCVEFILAKLHWDTLGRIFVIISVVWKIRNRF